MSSPPPPDPAQGDPRPRSSNGDLTPAPQGPGRGSYEKLEEKISSLAATVSQWQRDLDNAASRSSRLEGAFTVLLSSLEGWKSDIREVASRTESRVLRGLEVIDSRISRVQPAGAAGDVKGEVQAAFRQLEQSLENRIESLRSDLSRAGGGAGLMEGLGHLDQRLQAIEQRVTNPEGRLSARLSESFEALDQRLRAIEQRVQAQDAELPARLAESTGNLERRISEGQERLREEVSRSNQSSSLDELAAALQQLQAKLAENQEGLNRKLDAVQSESDENNATQLRYLAGLEELQATVAKRIKGLEEVVANPLDAQQWERLAKGLEFLDSKLAQSYDSVANRLDKAIATLTATLDHRAATGQEANLKSAERLWRALRGLEDQITGSYEMVRQSQERLESASANVSGAVEELRAVTGARAGHTEKLMMEGLENLDARFSQNLVAVSENLSRALFALNKATEEWRSELFNATEESEERVANQIGRTESKLAGELKSGLDALGRREERMLALILGGGAPTSGMAPPDEPAGKPERD